MLRALIFDVDGTLAETEELHRRAFNETFAAVGLPWHWDEQLYGALLKVTGGKERLRHFVETYDPPINYDPSGDRVEGLDDLVKALHQRKTRRYTALVEAGAVALRPGVARLLRDARKHGIRLAIATTTSLPNVEALLAAALGADGATLFEVIGAGDSVANKKPAPDIYFSVLEQLGLAAPDCIAIEDSENGLRAARAAGLPVLITKSRYTDKEAFDGAAMVLESLSSRIDHCGSGEKAIDVVALRELLERHFREVSQSRRLEQ